jgi:hypothetical protein
MLTTTKTKITKIEKTMQAGISISRSTYTRIVKVGAMA